MAGHPLEHLLSTLEIHVGSIALCEIGPGMSLAQSGGREIGVYYALRGEGWLDVEGSDPIRFGPGCVAIVPRGRGSRLGALRGAEMEAEAGGWGREELGLVDATGGGTAEIRLVWGLLSPDHASSIGLFDNLIAPIVEDLAGEPASQPAFELVLAEWPGRRFGSRALIETIVKQCLILAMRRHYERNGLESPLFAPYRDQRLLKVAGEVVRMPGGAYTIDMLAASIGMSRSAFVKKFSDCFGRSPMEFVAAVRLEAAARMLVSSALPIKAVANAVGFASRSHFSRAFRARYGTDPSSYRADAAGGETDGPARR